MAARVGHNQGYKSLERGSFSDRNYLASVSISVFRGWNDTLQYLNTEILNTGYHKGHMFTTYFLIKNLMHIRPNAHQDNDKG